VNKAIVSKDARLREPIASLADFKIHPAITVAANEVVLFNELVRDVRHFNADIFRVGHGSIQIEIFQIDGAKTHTFSRKHAVQ